MSNIFKTTTRNIFLTFILIVSSFSFENSAYSWSLTEDQKTLSFNSSEFPNLQSLYLPSVKSLNFDFLQLEDISWMNTSFPNIEKINVKLRTPGRGQKYGRKLLFLLQQLREFPSLASLYIQINYMPNDIFSEETKEAILNINNLKELTINFYIYRGDFNYYIYPHLKSEIEKLKQLTDATINLQFDVWDPRER